MDYISVKQAADKWGITMRRVQKLSPDRPIPRVELVSRDCLIPLNAE